MSTPQELLSIKEAASRGICYLRQPQWANPLSHLKVDISPDGTPGFYLYFFDPYNKLCNGRDPVTMLSPLFGNLNEPCFLQYEGNLADSDEYIAAVAAYDEAEAREQIKGVTE